MKEVRETLIQKQGDKPIRQFAKEIGIHYTQLSAVLNGRQELRNAKVLAKIGFRYFEHYQRI